METFGLELASLRKAFKAQQCGLIASRKIEEMRRENGELCENVRIHNLSRRENTQAMMFTQAF